MSDKDELARELFIADNFNQPREQSIVDWQWFMETPRFAVRIERYKAMAEGVITAGYAKPRQITTVEELDALALKSILLDSDSEAVQRIDDETMDGCSLWETALGLVTSGLVMLPATVLWEPLP